MGLRDLGLGSRVENFRVGDFGFWVFLLYGGPARRTLLGFEPLLSGPYF